MHNDLILRTGVRKLAGNVFVGTNTQNGLSVSVTPKVRFCLLGQRPKPYNLFCWRKICFCQTRSTNHLIFLMFPVSQVLTTSRDFQISITSPSPIKEEKVALAVLK